jgi:hypothetical protein
MKIEFSRARFSDAGADVDINGHTCQIDSPWGLVREGLCHVRGPRDIVDLLHVASHPQHEGLTCCDAWPLVELAARYWRISCETPGVWPKGEVEILRDRGAALKEWVAHVEKLEKHD